MYYIYGVSLPSLLIESTDSVIHVACILYYSNTLLPSHAVTVYQQLDWASLVLIRLQYIGHLSIVANLVRNGCEANVREILGPRPFLYCHTHYFGNLHDYAQNPPTMPTKSRDIRTKIGQYTKVRLVPHPFCALYIVTYCDISRGGIRNKSGTHPIFSGLFRQFRDSWQLYLRLSLGRPGQDAHPNYRVQTLPSNLWSGYQPVYKTS